MKLLPVYLNCVLKSDVLQPGPEVTIDDRAYVRQLISSMDVSDSNVFFYPRLLSFVSVFFFVFSSFSFPFHLFSGIFT